MRTTLAMVSLTAALLAGADVRAQDAPPPTESTEVDSIEVRGQPLVDAVRAFVQDASGAPRGNTMARWDSHDGVCVGVVNLRADYAQALVDQISAVAMVVGLEPGEPGCTPNILILADSDGDTLARFLVDQEPRTFRPDLDDSNLGRAALRRFQTSGAPVRWWHVQMAADPVTGVTVPDGVQVSVRNVSRIRNNFHQELVWSIIILDTSRIGSISFASLADYVSMIALGQFDDRADTTRWRSVLNLFAPDPEDVRMTQWDLDFLRGLYAARADGSVTRQSTDIGWEMSQQREARLGAPDPASD